MERIYDVQKANIRILRSNPPQIIVSASGRVNSIGWTRESLDAFKYPSREDWPKDGILDFEFNAEPPPRSIPVEPEENEEDYLSISAVAETICDPANYWGRGKPLVGVRIHARKNVVEAKLEAGSERYVPMGEGLPLPWPFPWRPFAAPSLWEHPWRPVELESSVLRLLLVGRLLRVIESGDEVPPDYRSDRVTLEVNPTTGRIVSAGYK